MEGFLFYEHLTYKRYTLPKSIDTVVREWCVLHGKKHFHVREVETGFAHSPSSSRVTVKECDGSCRENELIPVKVAEEAEKLLVHK